MIWKYRAVNNPVAKKKWLMYSVCLIVLAIATIVYRISSGLNPKKGLIALTSFFLVIFLYTIIMLGKERYYFINDEIRYKPFKTRLEDIENFEVDKENKLIRLKLRKSSLFAVKTLYFEDEEEMDEVVRFLEKTVGKGGRGCCCSSFTF